MIVRHTLLPGRARRSMFLIGVSVATLATGLSAMPARAQTAAALLGGGARAPRPQGTSSLQPTRSLTMQGALARQQATQSQVSQVRAYASALRDAIVRSGATDGLSDTGLDPIDTVKQAAAAAAGGDSGKASDLLVSVRAANDTTGINSWEGAGLPTQTVVDGRTVVSIDQTQQRALLSWKSFNVGQNTTLQFNQKQNGIAQPDWVVVNRTINAIKPSLILGNVKADGTVVVINQAGIIFGANSQVNTHSLIASTLELGNAWTKNSQSQLVASSIADRDAAYLSSGLFGQGNGTLTKDTTTDPSGPGVLVSAKVKNTDAVTVAYATPVEGDIIVDRGARITSGDAGLVVMAAPRISVSGTISAVDGQVSLQAGRIIPFEASTGAASSFDPYVRGYKFTTYQLELPPTVINTYKPQAGDGSISVDGTIASRLGYLSLGTGPFGAVTVNGYLEATTGVSRNGKIALLSGNVTLGGSTDPSHAAGIAILPDVGTETIPQGSAADPSSFKSSQIVIGAQINPSSIGSLRMFDQLVSTDFTMGTNAVIYAPNADVQVGKVTADGVSANAYLAALPGRVDIASGATIDVSGLKDVQRPLSDAIIAITPVKRNELSDTPNYREVAIGDDFSLNGTTLYIDSRVSGVRDDGVAWVGSPLIQGGSLVSQIPGTVSDFMTKGGTVTLNTTTDLVNPTITAAKAPGVHIARDATIDVSGGWVNYLAGTVRTSRLLTDDGRIVDIGQADPNDHFVAVVEGTTSVQPRFGIIRNFLTAASQSTRYEGSYDEGRDAGSLSIATMSATVDGTLYGNAFAGSRQVLGAVRPSVASTIAGDTRRLQKSSSDLPAGANVSIASLGDVIVYHGTRGPADTDGAELLLNDAMLNGAGLSALSLTAAGSVTFANGQASSLAGSDALTLTGASSLTLAPGGTLSVDAGRTIRFDGTIAAASGSILAKTELVGATTQGIATNRSNGSAFRTGVYGQGTGDDINPFGLYAADPGDLRAFDIVVTGSLSTAGLWVNDYLDRGVSAGSAFQNGGTIGLTSAAKIFAAIGASSATATAAVDLSGSIRVLGRLDVSAGGYVSAAGKLSLAGTGGNVALTDATVYASTELTINNPSFSGTSNFAFNGTSQSVDFTPLPAGSDGSLLTTPELVPTPRSTVDISGATISGFGFGGGGSFTLVAPDIAFGSDTHAGGTRIGLDFLQRTGFGTLNLTSYRSRIVDDLFTNARAGKSAFLETSGFVVKAGETLDLTQWVLPSLLSTDQARSLRGLASGSSLLGQSYMAPIKPVSAFDQRAANLVLSGLTELDVLAGGAIVGAAQASVTLDKLSNAGSIVLHGGTITQRNDLVTNLVSSGLGVRDADLGGNGLSDAFGGTPDAAGRYSESAFNAAGVRDAQTTRLLTNAELVSKTGADRLVYYLGQVDAGQGIVLAAGSRTDLSGVALFDPRAPVTGGRQLRTGRVIGGGSISLGWGTLVGRAIGTAAVTNRGSTLVRDDAAAVDIRGATALYDQALGTGLYAPYQEWSAAGAISAMGGGTLGKTAILATGGATAAEGGSLEWLNPTLGTGDADTANYLSSAMIAQSGFDTLLARGSLTLDGTFGLSLRKALRVVAVDPLTINDRPTVVVKATSGSTATLAAGYVQFSSVYALGDTTATAPVQGTGTANVTFLAGAQGVDFIGGTTFTPSIGDLSFKTPGDIRFIGVPDSTGGAGRLPPLRGAVIADNNLTLDGYRVYATTGTGNLQALLEGETNAVQTQPFTVLAGGTLTIGNSYLDPKAPTPLSAGSHLVLAARTIVQNGDLAAPLGLLELGRSWTQSIRFGAGSLTTVSGNGLVIPYGTSTDSTEYYFPTRTSAITKMPTGELRLTAGSIVQDAGATFDGRGGGDVVGYQFAPGVGGSHDVLDRFNTDAFSANGYDATTGKGYQYPDQRQVFALVPVSAANGIAAYDPVLSADYGVAGPTNLYGAAAGRTVILDAAPGIAAGAYLLVPAKYAVSIPGALRVVENTATGAPLPGQSTQLTDGSVVVGGRYATAGTGIADSTRRSFTIETKDVFSKFSSIQTVSGTTTILANALSNDAARPRVALDAARVILSPLTELRIAGVFDTRPADGGQAGQFDISGSKIVITADDDTSSVPSGTLRLTAGSLNRLNAPSLFVGGTRSIATDGTTALSVTAQSLEVRQGANLTAAELLLGVGGVGSQLSVADGASLVAAGTLGTENTKDYTMATAGSLLRVAVGGERLVTRTGSGSSTLQIGAATLAGDDVLLDSSGTFAVSDAAVVSGTRVALSGASLRFDSGAAAAGQAGVIGRTLEAKLAQAQQLTLRSAGAIRFSAGTHAFNDLVLDTTSLALTPGATAADSLRIAGGTVTLRNLVNAADACATSGFCGSGDRLTIDAATVAFGANAVQARGFANGVTLIGRDGMYVDGTGTFSSGAAALTLVAPFLVDRSTVADPRAQIVRPAYGFLTSGDFRLTATGANAGATATGNATPGARITIGTSDARVASARIEGALVRATAGVVDIEATGTIALAGATLSTPGYLATFGDKADPVTVAANGGTVNLLSVNGGITTDAATRLVVDSGTGAAGTLNLLASRGTILFDAALDPDAVGNRTASLTFDSGTGAFDLSGFATRYGARFGGDLSIRSGAGDLNLDTGAALAAQTVTLTADGGSIRVAGTIDTAGVDVSHMTAADAADARVNGGAIALWGMNGVTLAGGALLDTHTTGYADTDSRVASAGDVTIGIGRDTAALTIAPGAVIDAGARRTQAALAAGLPAARLLPETITDAASGQRVTVYRYTDPDAGGTVHLRAPVLGPQDNKVAVSVQGAIQGAGSIEVEGFKRYDLDSIANSGLYSGVTRGTDGTIALDMSKDSSTSGGLANPFTQDFVLADGSASLVHFIQNFGISTVDGSSLAGMRLRPGVELNAAGAITTSSAWNLAAATFSNAQLQAAVAAGDLKVIPELTTGTQTRYSVVSGREGDFLENYASFLYRVGGSAAGEAPEVTLRAGGTLTVNRSISDGFFTFRDESDPAYVTYQLGGGNRTLSPGISFACGGVSGSCATLAQFQNFLTTNPSSSTTLVISLTTAPVAAGATGTYAPLAIAGNGAAGGGDGEDSLGFAELFPLLNGNVAMHSSDIRLVAGATTAPSANPLAVNKSSGANVTVAGEYGYGLTATAGTTTFNGPIQFSLNQNGLPPINFNVADTLDLSDPTRGLNQLSDGAYTQINWGNSTGLGADARKAALAFFAGKSFKLIGSSTSPTGIAASLADVVAFLESFGPTYEAGLASGKAGYTKPATSGVVSYGTANKAYVRSYVRSGDGNIALAAAGNVDLQGTPAAEYRQNDGTLTDQATFRSAGEFGAAAIYTAGVRVQQARVSARVIGTDTVLSMLPDSPFLAAGVTSRSFVPTPLALSDAPAVLATGGGDVVLDAGQDVLARHESWNDNAIPNASTKPANAVGTSTQAWSVGSVGDDTEIGVAPRYFASGVGALAGGDVSVRAGRDIVALTIALDSGVTTTRAGSAKTMLTLGSGNLAVRAGRDLLAGRFDIASGAARINVGRDIASSGSEIGENLGINPANLRVRLNNATVSVFANGSATLGSVSALGVWTGDVHQNRGSSVSVNNPYLDANAAAAGLFSPIARFSLQANGAVQITEATSGFPTAFGLEPSLWPDVSAAPTSFLQVLPPSLNLTALAAGVTLGDGTIPQMLYPSPIGQLNLLSQSSITNLVLAMSDVDPGLIGGAWSVSRETVPYRLPAVSPQTLDNELRYQHNQDPTHAGDDQPIRIYTNGDLTNAALFLPKEARVTAADDIVNLYFQGQNVAANDITRVRAGGDIKGVVGVATLPFVESNNFILGGPGELIVEAGGNIGPLMTSANVKDSDGRTYSFGGGIRTVGNDLNPWLGATGADVSVRFGMAQGGDYAVLRDTYLDPDNFAKLDGDLFAQVTDAFGNQKPDRTKPIYLPKLAIWLRDHAPDAFAQVFGGQNFTSDADLATAAYGKGGALYAAFAKVDPLRQQDFLTNGVLFGEIAAVSDVTGPSYQQYIRGYRAIQTLFPASLGYTDNLAAYTTDPSTVSADHPLGEPVRTIVNGQPAVAQTVHTGNLDLRLSTIQTGRGGNVSILGPGGDLIAGSTIRTADQPNRRNTGFRLFKVNGILSVAQGNLLYNSATAIASIPLGYEGILTLEGGTINSFTDGNVALNQSRVFTQRGGAITMWSSNGDLAAGQGPKSSSVFPPITIRQDADGNATVDSSASVAGAGIGTFKASPSDPASDVILIAPVGTVDAGDAGVRASGNIIVAAARVANADNFKAAGNLTGVPSATATVAVTPATDPSRDIRKLVQTVSRPPEQGGDQRSVITVKVLGPVTDGVCPAGGTAEDPDCAQQ